MLKKILKYAGVGLLLLVIAIFGWLEYSTVKNNAAPGELALAALASDDRVIVEEGVKSSRAKIFREQLFLFITLELE